MCVHTHVNVLVSASICVYVQRLTSQNVRRQADPVQDVVVMLSLQCDQDKLPQRALAGGV